MARDDFTLKTKDLLARRVGMRCSNPLGILQSIFTEGSEGREQIEDTLVAMRDRDF